MKLPLSIAITFLLASPVMAGCYGSDTNYRCSDASGNSYNVSKFGNTTSVRGQSANGESWSQRTTDFGNSSSTTGYDADGSSWN